VHDLLPYAWAEGLAYVQITADTINQPSRKVIEANGGRLVDEFKKADVLGGAESVRYRIERPAGYPQEAG
jgi:predicted acetyltransferase